MKYQVAALATVVTSLMLLGCPRPARADYIAVECSVPGISASDSRGTVAGYAFVTNAPITFTQLGAVLKAQHIDAGSSSVQVGLWDSMGNLLVSTTVLDTDPKVGHFYYHPVIPTRLASGQSILRVVVCWSLIWSQQWR
jgi:hypothetical protein